MAILDDAKNLAKNLGGKIKDEAGKIAGKVIDEAGNRIATGVGDKITGAFAAKSGAAEAPNEYESNVPSSQGELVNTVEKISSIPELTDFLTELQSKQDSESAVAYALKAQLQVLVVVNHADLFGSPFDLMLESLKLAVQKSKSEFEKTEFQQKAAVMINSMVFFMKAKLYYENDKWNEEGQEILKEACSMLADSAVSVASIAVTGGLTSGAIAGKLAGSLLDSIMSNRGGFIKRIMDWATKGERIEKYKTEFYTFLESAFDKLLRYKNLFGSSLILHNLVSDNKDVLSLRVGDKSPELKKLDPDNPVLKDNTSGLRFFFYSLGILFILLAVFLGFSYLFYLYNIWGGDKWVEDLANSSIFDMVFIIHFGILEHPLFIKIIIVLIGYLPTIFSASAVSRLGFNKVKIIKSKWKTQITNEYYTVLANKLDEY